MASIKNNIFDELRSLVNEIDTIDTYSELWRLYRRIKFVINAKVDELKEKLAQPNCSDLIKAYLDIVVVASFGKNKDGVLYRIKGAVELLCEYLQDLLQKTDGQCTPNHLGNPLTTFRIYGSPPEDKTYWQYLEDIIKKQQLNNIISVGSGRGFFEALLNCYLIVRGYKIPISAIDKEAMMMPVIRAECKTMPFYFEPKDIDFRRACKDADAKTLLMIFWPRNDNDVAYEALVDFMGAGGKHFLFNGDLEQNKRTAPWEFYKVLKDSWKLEKSVNQIHQIEKEASQIQHYVKN